jgi:hypothetical protein
MNKIEHDFRDGIGLQMCGNNIAGVATNAHLIDFCREAKINQKSEV